MSQYKNLLSELDNSRKINTAQGQEPHWMMQINLGSKPITASQFDPKSAVKCGKKSIKLGQCSQIYDHQFSLTRNFEHDSSANSILPGGLTGHELKVVAPVTSIEAEVHQVFSENIILSSVVLFRLITGGKTMSSKEAPISAAASYEFSDVFITGLVINSDLICLAFRYAAVEHQQSSVSPLTGAAAGAKSSSYHNLVTGAVAAK